MFAALARLVTVGKRPWIVLGLWIVAAVGIISTAPALTSTTDQAEFLPSHYESIKAATLQAEAFPQATSPSAILVFERRDGGQLTAEDSTKITGVVQDLNTKVDQKLFTEGVAQPATPDGKIQIAVYGIGPDSTGYDTPTSDAVKDMRADLKKLTKGSDVKVGVTGGAAQNLDSLESSEKTMAIVGIATILLIVVLLALIFRSVIICLLPILVVTLVSSVATGLIGFANEAFDLKADSSLQVILIVVLYGIGTDYILFLLFRYRERLREGEEPREAVGHALERAGEAIASAGGAVIVSFMALVLSSLSIFRSIGPALAIAVGVTLIAALTLVPALMALLGRALFWPSKAWSKEPSGTRYASLGRGIEKRPGVFAAASGLVLATLAIFAIGFSPSFDFNSSLPKGVESTEALNTLQESLPKGATDPSQILLKSDAPIDQAAADTFAKSIGEVDGVVAASPAVLSADGKTAIVSAVLLVDPMSDEAIDIVRGDLRTAAHKAAPDNTTALVGGTSSVFADLKQAMNRDYSVVFPVAAGLIMIILALLLRSFVAPWYLMVSVGLGFGATLGATVIVFQHLMGESGLIFMLPIYIYLFVVALGTDYNILMVARLREEAREGKEPREAAAHAVRHAGPTIAAAGVILAGTFGALMLGGNSLIESMGFALSFGIIVAAFVMATIFTPALTALIGHAAWWPGHGDRAKSDSASIT